MRQSGIGDGAERQSDIREFRVTACAGGHGEKPEE